MSRVMTGMYVALLLLGALTGHYLLSYISPLTVLPDKFFHFTAYLILGFLCGRTFGDKTALRRCGILVLLTAACDESLQLLIPARSASLTDLIADAVGAYCGWLLSHKILNSNNQ